MISHRTRVSALVSASCLVLAACGSTLEPQQVMSGQYGAIGESGVAADGSTAGTGTDPSGTSLGPGATTTGSGGSASGPTTTGGSTAASGSGGAAASGASGGGDAPPSSGSKGGSCDGFENGTGVTDDTIRIGVSADVSGPIPGIFESSQQAVKAYAAYFNASSDICGRKLEVVTYDTHTDTGGDQQAAVKACDEVFAMVGSMSAYDNGGAQAAEDCGIPDMRTAAVTPERVSASNSFGAQSTRVNLVAKAQGQFFAKHVDGATEALAMLYSGAPAAIVNSESTSEAYQAQGYQVVYDQELASSEFNYAPYVQEMKAEGVKMVHFVGSYQQAVRVAKAMEQQDFHPAFVLQPAAYDRGFIESGGSAVEDTYIYTDAGLFEDPTPELQLYLAWLDRVAPGATPTYFGQYAWGASRIFAEQAVKLGGKLTRESLIRAFGTVANYTANNMYAPMNPGPKRSSECQAVLQVKGGQFQQVSPGRYMCAGLVDTGVGG